MGSMRKMMAVMLMGLALTAFEVSSDAQSRSKSERKSAATANNRKPSPAVKPSTGSSSRPVRPDVKPGGTGNKPSGPAPRPNGPSTKPGGPGMKPAPKPAPKPGYRPAPKPEESSRLSTHTHLRSQAQDGSSHSCVPHPCLASHL